ncbi:MAG: TonB-dependent receptor, partial [Halobacteriales archaeon]|nr:TonB-dependent receptor [Halobacteriales archaeon]
DEARVFQGFNDDIRTEIRDTRLYWIEEDVLSSTLRGEHLFADLANSRIDWRLNYSRAERNEPDLRETLYEFNPAVSDFVLADESQSGFRMFNDLDDRVWDAGVDWSIFFSQWGGLPAELKLGGSYSNRERDFTSRRFRLTPRNVIGLDLSQDAEVLFAPENIGPFFELKEETRNTDTYSATHDLYSGYAMLDLPLSRKLRFVGGARIESSDQEVRTFDPFAVTPRVETAVLDDVDILPGINLVYGLTNEMNVRGSFSRTVNRPEFRELSPFEFTDVVGGRAIVGNPNLKRATIDNFDLRWEWFTGPGEVVAVSVFHKEFTDPIERIVEPTAQLRTSFDNALGAT